jgi:ABC-2 type transport system ATP-binding protein
MSYAEALKKLKFWFEKLNILDWWNKKVEELSKGMAQKIQFVVTVIHEPKLLIFDEPFSGFDPINAAIIRQEILELSKKGTTIIFSTHRMESVEEICDHIALINKSQTILEGPIEEIKKQFTNNTYEVITANKELKENDCFTIINKKENTFQILLKEGKTQKDILQSIIKDVEIISFKKETPSMEEIFIKAVSNA